MANIVYTRNLVRAIVEETRLNAEPTSNPSLYSLVQGARQILSHPAPESLDPDMIADVEAGLKQYPRSYAAQYRREELLEFEAWRIISARDVFELDRVARLVRDLGDYKAAKAHEARHELDSLWQIVQEAKYHATGVQKAEGSRGVELLAALKPYASLSTEVSGVHRQLADFLWRTDPFYALSNESRV